MVDFDGFPVGKYTSPMNGMGTTSTATADTTTTTPTTTAATWRIILFSK